MDTMTRPFEVDPRAALVGGTGVVVAHVLVLRPIGLWSGAVPAVVQGAALAIGFAVLAFGLPRALTGDAVTARRPRTGAVGTSRIARGSLAAAGLLALVVSIWSAFAPTDAAALFSDAGRVFATVLSSLNYAGVLALVAAAVFATTSEGAGRGARIGLWILAILSVVAILIPLVLQFLPADSLASFLGVWEWEARASDLAACGVGVGLAWPWLGHRVDRAVRASTQAYDRWVDSTP
jgi:hypothetical protein